MLLTEFNIDIAKEVWQEEASDDRAIEIAKNALVLGIPVDTIVKLTGLTREEIENLRDAG